MEQAVKMTVSSKYYNNLSRRGKQQKLQPSCPSRQGHFGALPDFMKLASYMKRRGTLALRVANRVLMRDTSSESAPEYDNTPRR